MCSSDLLAPAARPDRLHLIIGRGVPVDILRELDVKVDDGNPDSGVLRATIAAAVTFVGVNSWGGSDATCTDNAGGPLVYNTAGNSPDCNGVFLF